MRNLNIKTSEYHSNDNILPVNLQIQKTSYRTISWPLCRNWNDDLKDDIQGIQNTQVNIARTELEDSPFWVSKFATEYINKDSEALAPVGTHNPMEQNWTYS